MGSLGTYGPCVWADPERGGYDTGAPVRPVLKSGAAGKPGTSGWIEQHDKDPAAYKRRLFVQKRLAKSYQKQFK